MLRWRGAGRAWAAKLCELLHCEPQPTEPWGAVYPCGSLWGFCESLQALYGAPVGLCGLPMDCYGFPIGFHWFSMGP